MQKMIMLRRIMSSTRFWIWYKKTKTQERNSLLSSIKRMLPANFRRELKRLVLNQPRICPQVYAWAKANPNSAKIVKEFWGPYKLRRQIPKSLDGSDVLPMVFSRNLEYPLYEKTLFCIKNATMRGKEGIVFLPDGSVTHQTAWSAEQITSTDTYRKKWRGREVFKRGNCSTLILFWGLGYYHWFNDVF